MVGRNRHGYPAISPRRFVPGKTTCRRRWINSATDSFWASQKFGCRCFGKASGRSLANVEMSLIISLLLLLQFITACSRILTDFRIKGCTFNAKCWGRGADTASNDEHRRTIWYVQGNAVYGNFSKQLHRGIGVCLSPTQSQRKPGTWQIISKEFDQSIGRCTCQVTCNLWGTQYFAKSHFIHASFNRRAKTNDPAQSIRQCFQDIKTRPLERQWTCYKTLSSCFRSRRYSRSRNS